MQMSDNKQKKQPKNNIKFNISLSDEQKRAKENIISHAYSFVVGRADNAVVIVDEFQNLTKAQLRMALGRLGRNSVMIFCGDNQQVDLKDSFNSAIDDIAKMEPSEHVYKVVLEDNHRHKAINEVLKLLTGY